MFTEARLKMRLVLRIGRGTSRFGTRERLIAEFERGAAEARGACRLQAPLPKLSLLDPLSGPLSGAVRLTYRW